MWWLLKLPLVVFLGCIIDKGYSFCVNNGGDTVCDAEAAIGECWLKSTLPCICAKSCNTPSNCADPTLDLDCGCYNFVAHCHITAILSNCPTTCDRRNTVDCNPLESVPNASPSIMTPLYGDKVTYTCDAGFNQTGGDDGFRACITDGSWVVSTRTGVPPACEDIDECALSTDDCDSNAQCVNTPGSFSCTCNAGYIGNGSFGNCNDMNECALSADDCDTNARCTNTVGSYTCSCNTGYTGDGTNGNCNGISCGPSPDVEGCVPSAPSGSYPDDITYDCVPGSMKLHGGTARHTCIALGVWTKDSNDTIPYCVYETEHYRTSVYEIDSAATPILATMTARSGLECARFCSLSPDCEGYTYSKSTQVCRHNVGPYLPIVTEMKKVYVQV